MEAPRKWYPVLKSTGLVKDCELAALLADETTLNPKEIEMAIYQLFKFIVRLLLKGATVPLGDMGTFCITISSAGSDTSTSSADGTITPNDDIRIEGDKLRISPDGGEGLGVFFVNESGEATPVTRRLTQNDPKTLIARVPALPAGEYTLRVVTRFTGGSTLLNQPRVIEYDRLLTVE